MSNYVYHDEKKRLFFGKYDNKTSDVENFRHIPIPPDPPPEPPKPPESTSATSGSTTDKASTSSSTNAGVVNELKEDEQHIGNFSDMLALTKEYTFLFNSMRAGGNEEAVAAAAKAHSHRKHSKPSVIGKVEFVNGTAAKQKPATHSSLHHVVHNSTNAKIHHRVSME
jgi:hypothetical protein